MKIRESAGPRILQFAGDPELPVFEMSNCPLEYTFNFPLWLFEELDFLSKKSDFSQHSSIRLRLHGEGPQIAVGYLGGGLATILMSILIKDKSPLLLRRKSMLAYAEQPHDSEFRSDTSQSLVRLPNRVAEELKSAEKQVLEVWNSFVERCKVPESFQIHNRPPLSLAELIILRNGIEETNHRQYFADHFPWVTRSILTTSADPEAEFRAIDDDPRNSISVAAKYLCCSQDPDCDKAVRFAKLLPRHRSNAGLDELLGITEDGRQKESRIRSVFLGAHLADRELITHIGTDIELAKRQIEKAVEVVLSYMDSSPNEAGFSTACELASLLVRMMVRNTYDPDRLGPEQLAAGLVAVSADSLAAYVAKHQEDMTVISPVPDASALDVGVLAFVSYVGEPVRPRLTMNRFERLTAQARALCRQYSTLIEDLPETSWPSPPGWGEGLANCVDGVSIECLTSADQLIEEGQAMQNCLRLGNFRRPALSGDLVLLSIQALDGRATLALKPIMEKTNGNGVRIADWEDVLLRGVENRAPSLGCKRCAKILLQEFRNRCPLDISPAEVERRVKVRRQMDIGTYNANVTDAQQRWNELYKPLLPRSFDKVSPGLIVSKYLNCNPV